MILKDEAVRRVVIQGDDLPEVLSLAAEYVEGKGPDWRNILDVKIETGLPGGSYVTIIYEEASDANAK